MEYTPDPALRKALLSEPEIQAARKDMANMYRKARKLSPALGRLLRKAFKEAENKAMESFFSGPSTGGLSDLINP